MICFLAIGVFVTNGLIFQCHFVITSWLYIGSIYDCEAVVQNDGMEMVLNNVTGVHVGARKNSNVRGLTVLDQFTKRIPRNMNTFFPKLIGLIWVNSGLQTVSAEDLEQFPELEVIKIQQNQVTTLEGNLFMHNGPLKSIGFDSNSIRYVGKNLLDNLPALQVVLLRYNPCVNHYANTTETIAALNANLPLMCPMPLTEPPTEPPVTTPGTTTIETTIATTTESTTTFAPTTEECAGECLELVDQLLDRISELEDMLNFCLVTVPDAPTI